MACYPARPKGDNQLVQIVDAALADVASRAGDWLACRPGCTQCCVGVFAINQLDASRLRDGLDQLDRSDPSRTSRVRERAQASVARLAPDFPGNKRTGILGRSDSDRARFEDFANDEPCPALDPVTGLCDVYEFRPMTCRVFGPPVRTEGGLSTCELCFHGATDQQIAACEMVPDPDDLEAKLLKTLPARTRSAETIVAYVLADLPK